jgi:hypothetical protein
LQDIIDENWFEEEGRVESVKLEPPTEIEVEFLESFWSEHATELEKRLSYRHEKVAKIQELIRDVGIPRPLRKRVRKITDKEVTESRLCWIFNGNLVAA